MLKIKWIKDLHIKPDTPNLIEEKVKNKRKSKITSNALAQGKISWIEYLVSGFKIND